MKKLLTFLFVATLVLPGCFTKGLDPDLAMAQTKPLYEYTKPLVEAHETDPMKKEDFEALWAAWFNNVKKAKDKDGDQ